MEGIHTFTDETLKCQWEELYSALCKIDPNELQFPEIMQIITNQWPVFSPNQVECLLIVITKWAVDGVCSKALHNRLLDVYNDCSELSKKFYLHSILLNLKEPSIEAGNVSCTAPAINYEIPETGIVDEDICYKGFLSLVERYIRKSRG